MPFDPTEQQVKIVTAAKRGVNIKVGAGAGAGKTSTLELIAAALSPRQGIYIAYNRAISDEAKSRFPANVRCSTAHSLAYRSVGRRYVHRLSGARQPARVAARILGIFEAVSVTTFDERDITLAPVQLARIALETVQRFCYSADERISSSHVPFQAGLDSQAMSMLTRSVLPFAQRAWEDLSNVEGSLKFEHDHYLKLWGLEHPRLNCDFVMLDEAQDANPVIADIVARQHCQKILVGDENQAIYGWRGAIDAMRTFDGEELWLTKSFRFGSAVADEANKWLTLLGSYLRIEGFEQIKSELITLDEPDAVLCRTNAGAIAEAIQALHSGRRPHLVGGGDTIKHLAQAAKDLQDLGHTDHPELFVFASWEEVREYVNEDSAGSDLKVFVKMIDTMGADAVIDACSRLVSEETADVIISTAHKAKGREWATVRVSTDFHQPDEGKLPGREEMMLAYVTVTRAKLALDTGGLAYINELITGEMTPLTSNETSISVETTSPANAGEGDKASMPTATKAKEKTSSKSKTSTKPVAEKKTTKAAAASTDSEPTASVIDTGANKAKNLFAGKQKGHIILGKALKGGSFEIVSWTLPDGKPAPKKVGIVGETYTTISEAGKQVFAAMHDAYGTPENLEGRSMTFRDEDGRPVAAADYKDPNAGSRPTKTAEKSEKAPKASKTKATEVEEPAAKSKTNGAKGSAKKADSGAAKSKTTARRPRMTIEIGSKKEQEGLAPGETRFHCLACAGLFVGKLGKNGEIPSKCPKGHKLTEFTSDDIVTLDKPQSARKHKSDDLDDSTALDADDLEELDLDSID